MFGITSTGGTAPNRAKSFSSIGLYYMGISGIGEFDGSVAYLQYELLSEGASPQALSSVTTINSAVTTASQTVLIP